MRAISKAEQIAFIAQKAVYTAALTAREWTTPRLVNLLAQCALARNAAGGAVTQTVNKEGDTLSEAGTKKALVVRLKEIQKAAKQKFRATNANRLKAYFVGTRFEQSRALLEQDALTILNNAATDALPGITPAKISAGHLAIKAYKDSNVTQTTAQGGAADLRVDLTTLLRGINDERISLQLAADAEWPHTDAANIPIRREFQLPTRSGFNV